MVSENKIKLTFNTKLPELYDFMYIIDILLNGNKAYENRQTRLSLKSDTRVLEAEEYIWKDVDESTPGLALFFKHGKDRKGFIKNTYIRLLEDYDSSEHFIDFLENMEIRELRMALLGHYDHENRDGSFYNELLDDNESLYSFINSLDNEALQKWEMTVMMNNPDEIMNPFIGFCRLISKRIKHVYRKNSALFKSVEKRIGMKITGNPVYFINNELKHFSNHMSPYESGRITISYSFLQEYFGYSLWTPTHRIIILGFHYDRSLKLLDGPSEILDDEAFFKALGDKTRLRIIKLLLQRKMYVGEIARQCNLRISTISYHLEVLSSGGIVGRDSAKNHVYYMLRDSHVRERLKLLIDLFS